MRQIFIGAALLVASATATAASAQTIASYDFQPTLPAGAKVVDFDSPLPSGFSLNGGTIVQGNGSGYAAPAGDATKYLVTGNGGKSTVSADQAYQSVGFYWGSIDKFNTVSLLDAVGGLVAKFTGNDIPPSNGDQSSAATNRYVSYTLDPAQAIAGIKSLVFESGGTAFEVDNVAFGTQSGSPAPVPEPATLGLFAIGLGALGRRMAKRRAA